MYFFHFLPLSSKVVEVGGGKKGVQKEPDISMDIWIWEVLGRPYPEVYYDIHPFKFYNA